MTGHKLKSWLRCRNFIAEAEARKRQKQEINAATLITKNIRNLIAKRKVAKQKVIVA